MQAGTVLETVSEKRFKLKHKNLNLYAESHYEHEKEITHMGERSLDHLNRLVLLKEEIIESYGRMVSEVKDPELKNRLRSNQENHFKNMMAFSDRVMELGGQPKFDLGLHGIHEDMRHFENKRSNSTDLEAAKIALMAEQQDSEKLLSFDLSDEDSQSNELIERAVNSDKDNIRALEEYIKGVDIQ